MKSYPKLSDWTRAVLRTGLSGRSPQAIDRAPTSDEWAAILPELRSGRVVALAVHAIVAGDVVATEEQLDQLVEGHLLLGDAADQCDAKLAEALELFDRSSIDYRVTKGVATSRLAYPDHTWRLYGDSDVFVSPGDFGEALGTLEAAGFVSRVESEHRRRFFHAIPVSNDDSGAEVDLHRAPAMGFLGTRVPEAVWFDGSAAIEVAGRQAVACDLPALLLHACFHANTRRPHLSTARDIAQLFAHPEFSHSRFDELVARSDSAPIVETSLEWCATVLGVLPEFLPSVPPSRKGQFFTSLEQGNSDALVLTTLLGQRGLRGKLRFSASAIQEGSFRGTASRAARIFGRLKNQKRH